MNGNSVSGINRPNAALFKSPTTTINSSVVFRSMTERLDRAEGRDATSAGERKLSTSFRNSVALDSAAAVARSAFSSESSAAYRAFFDLLEPHQEKTANKSEALASTAETKSSIPAILRNRFTGSSPKENAPSCSNS